MKKIACLLLAMIALIGLFAACSASTPAPYPPPPAGASSAPGYPPPGAYAPEMEDAYGYAPYDPGEQYLKIDENAEKLVSEESMLTFSLKVDTASYSNVERYISNYDRPPADAVRTEELLNYFQYDGEMSFTSGSPFSIYTEIGRSPFNFGKYMAFIRVKTKDIDKDKLPSSNLTFLIDTSGSMDSYDKLPLLKDAFGLLVETLNEDDRVSVVTYAGSSLVLLDSESGENKDRILRAIDNLSAGGSTAGANGIMTAYELAERNFVTGGNNRVILATDGDFNVGTSDVNELERLISRKRDSGIYLSVLGVGTGNIRDDIMETLAKNGNGNYSYINSLHTAKKVLVDELASNLFTLADDVKAQIEFNPENVVNYRLVGYENRRLSNADFNNDAKDAGEIGVGTDVVVMFELELKGGSEPGLKYSDATSPAPGSGEYGDELFEVRIRYKNPGESESNLIVEPVKFVSIPGKNSTDFNFACSVAAFGELLRDSAYKNEITIADIISLAENNFGRDAEGYRYKFFEMLNAYSRIR